MRAQTRLMNIAGIAMIARIPPEIPAPFQVEVQLQIQLKVQRCRGS
jgi:hypothetical protein